MEKSNGRALDYFVEYIRDPAANCIHVVQIQNGYSIQWDIQNGMSSLNVDFYFTGHALKTYTVK